MTDRWLTMWRRVWWYIRRVGGGIALLVMAVLCVGAIFHCTGEHYQITSDVDYGYTPVFLGAMAIGCFFGGLFNIGVGFFEKPEDV